MLVCGGMGDTCVWCRRPSFRQVLHRLKGIHSELMQGEPGSVD
jgi:hypothetical protein